MSLRPADIGRGLGPVGFARLSELTSVPSLSKKRGEKRSVIERGEFMMPERLIPFFKLHAPGGCDSIFVYVNWSHS